MDKIKYNKETKFYDEVGGVCPYCFSKLLSEEDYKRIKFEKVIVDPNCKKFSSPIETKIMIMPSDLDNHRSWEVDHIIPKSKKGSNMEDNLIACCIECNSAKGAKLIKLNKKQLLNSLKIKASKK